jgi:hypothetical protein
MNITLTLTFSWPIAAMILAWLWLPVCVAIGNTLQMEWWLNVLVISVFAAFGMTIFAVVSVFI